MQLRNVKRCFFLREAFRRLHKKHPQYRTLLDHHAFTLYIIYSLQPVRSKDLLRTAKDHERPTNGEYINDLEALNLISREKISSRASYFTITPAGIHYLQLLDKYIKESRIDR